ncbi:glycerophosphodiester phosphodiesterase [Brachybacterium sp. GCM10030268]|uniref:glycerophosphodiester phosphodiesterase n=1 Tax=Brachybacterium sp. GCM10030268 TaxID=3273382 RepID=UPI0036060F8C
MPEPHAPTETAAPAHAERPSRPVVVGHRGAPVHAPENTLGGFRRAFEDGAQLLECDVHLSADGHVMVMHDESIDRTADPASLLRTGALGDLTRAELGRVLLADGERIPTLEELLEMTTVPVFIEVKVAPAAQAVAAILRDLPTGSPAARSTVISFHPEALAEIRRATDAPVSYLVRQVDERALETARELDAAGIGPWIGGLSLRAAESARAAGLAVNPWTINSPQELAVARACGVDTITTDDPAWVLGELGAA